MRSGAQEMQGFVLGRGTFRQQRADQARDKFSEEADANCDKYEHLLIPKDQRRT